MQHSQNITAHPELDEFSDCWEYEHTGKSDCNCCFCEGKFYMPDSFLPIEECVETASNYGDYL